MTDTFFGPGTVDTVKCHVNSLDTQVDDLIYECNLINSLILLALWNCLRLIRLILVTAIMLAGRNRCHFCKCNSYWHTAAKFRGKSLYLLVY